MKAISKYMEVDVIKADDYVKSVIPAAKYMKIFKGFTFTFVPDEDGEYKINGKRYQLISTNPHDWLVEHIAINKEQMTIFDFL